MSEENVRAVKRGLEAWESGDFEALLDLYDEEVVTSRRSPLPDPGTWHGREGMLEMASEWLEGFDEFVMRGEDYTDAGDQVIVRVTQEARSSSGVPVTGVFWFVVRFRAGKVVRMDIYATRPEALEAAGVAEPGSGEGG